MIRLELTIFVAGYNLIDDDAVAPFIRVISMHVYQESVGSDGGGVRILFKRWSIVVDISDNDGNLHRDEGDLQFSNQCYSNDVKHVKCTTGEKILSLLKLINKYMYIS